VIERVGGFEESFRDCFEDQVLLAKVGLHSPVFVADEPTDKYRQHTSSCTSRAARSGVYAPDRPNAARLAYLRWLAGYASEQRLQDATFWRVLDEELWPYRHPTLYRVRSQTMGALRALARRVLPAPLVNSLRTRRDKRRLRSLGSAY
jgi:hypothetical protein